MPLAGILDAAGGRGGQVERSLGAADVTLLERGPLTVGHGPTDHAASSTGDALTCVLTGSIYNLADVAEALELPERPDAAATLLAGWERLGEGLPEILRGDFALAIWEAARGEGVLVRDQMAGGGLYWHSAGGRVAFASEAHLLLRLLPSRPGPDAASMASWLALHGPPPDRTLYEGVNRLEAGHLLRFGGDAPRPRRYWRLRYERPPKLERDDAVGLLRTRLVEAVKRRASHAGDSFVLLSGGLDSSTVAALAHHYLPAERRPGRAYSAVFPEHPSVDERELMDTLCGAIALPSTRIEVRGGSVLSGAHEYIESWELPPISPNLFFWLPLLRRAEADGRRVMLDGEGGDELFGLSLPLIGDRLLHGRLVSAARLSRRLWTLGGAGSPRHRWHFAYRPALKAIVPAGLHQAARRVRGPRRYSPPWFLEPTARAFWETTSGAESKRIAGPRWWSTLVQNVTRGLGPALGYDHMRRRAALAGIQPRHPLVDVDVIECVLRLPPELAFDPMLSRPLFREAGAGLVPDELRLRRSKSNFDAIFHASLAGPDLPLVRRLLADPRAELGAYIDLELVRRELLDPEPPSAAIARQGWAMFCWRMATAEMWLRAQGDSSALAALLGEASAPAYELTTRHTG